MRAATPDSLRPDPTWLEPEGSTLSPDRRVRLLPAGVLWDALQVPEARALPVLHRLLADEHDRALLGPVLRDERTKQVHWLVSPGHTATWPDGCRLLTSGWLAVPGQHCKRLSWLHLPEPGILTGAPWLAAAFHDSSSAAVGGIR